MFNVLNSVKLHSILTATMYYVYILDGDILFSCFQTVIN